MRCRRSVGSSYDAQRNEFCAYVLHESQTPYGLLLGQLQNLRAIDRQRRRARPLGRRYRSDHLRHAPDRLSARDDEHASSRIKSTRELTFLPYAQISEFTLEHRIHVTEAFYVPHGPAFDRAVSLRRRRDALQSGADEIEVARLSVGDARRATLLRRARARGARLERRALHLLEKSRNGRRALVGRIAPAGRRSSSRLREQVLLESMRRGTLAGGSGAPASPT